jgi:hypothetical protein
MLNERKLTKPELTKREDIVKSMKDNKRDLVKKYGKDAEKVMYGRATNIAKKKTESMNSDKLKEMIEAALKNPKKADLNKDGKLSDYEKKRGAAIEKNIEKKTLKEGIPTDLEPLAFDILHRSLRNRYITIEEATDESVIDAAREVAEFHADDEEIGSSDMTFIIKEFLDSIGKETGFENGRLTVSKNTLTENKREAFDELQMIMDQLYELSDQAKMIFRNNFPTEYRRLDAYGALDFGTSSNRYDVTLEGALENLDMEDDDEDMMQEDRKAKEYIKSIEDEDEREAERKRMFDNPEEENVREGFRVEYKTQDGENAKSRIYKTKEEAEKKEAELVDKSRIKQAKIVNVDSGLNEDLDLGHQDNEPHMLKGDLYRIGKYAMELYQMMDSLEGQGEVDFPHWWQSKISNAKSSIVGAKHYLDFELKEPQIDAMVGVAAEEDVIDEGKDMSKFSSGQKITWSSPNGPKKDEIEAIKGIYLKLKSGGTIPYQSVIDEGMSDEEWAKAKEEDRLAKLPKDQQAKIKKAIAMLKAEKKPKRLAEKLKGNKKQLDEYTENNFSGNDLIAQTPQPGRDELATYDYFFPDGVASRSKAISSLQAHDESPIKARMGRYAPMFAHVQYHEFEDEMAGKYRVYQTQYYNSNFADKDPNFNPRVTKLTLFKLTPSGDTDKEVDMGSILVKTDDYIRDLKNLNITNRQS